MSISRTLERSDVMLVVGSGGVGKTTTAAALAIKAARDGRKTVVVTVDPAKRLADALGMPGGLTADPQQIDIEASGELWALMLDPRTTFERLIARESTDDALTAELKNNRVYGNLANGLSGTQEYLATEELYSLHQDDRFDLVIVDTPPSRHVLDIVDAPSRLVSLFDNTAYRLLTGRGTNATRLVGKAAQRMVRTVAGLVGTDVVEDAIDFFNVFESLEGGFRERAVAVNDLLTSPSASVVIVAGPKADVIVTACDLIAALEQRSMAPDAAIINFFHPDPLTVFDEDDAGRNADDAACRLHVRASAEQAASLPLVQMLGQIPVVRVPSLADDIHDADGLGHVVACLADDTS
jgi:anion-transporting  ArsA/GET3 family ATPase